MAKFHRTYANSAMAERLELETEVEADGHYAGGRFIYFSRNQEVVLQVAAAQVLQIRRVA